MRPRHGRKNFALARTFQLAQNFARRRIHRRNLPHRDLNSSRHYSATVETQLACLLPLPPLLMHPRILPRKHQEQIHSIRDAVRDNRGGQITSASQIQSPKQKPIPDIFQNSSGALADVRASEDHADDDQADHPRQLAFCEIFPPRDSSDSLEKPAPRPSRRASRSTPEKSASALDSHGPQ